MIKRRANLIKDPFVSVVPSLRLVKIHFQYTVFFYGMLYYFWMNFLSQFIIVIHQEIA